MDFVCIEKTACIVYTLQMHYKSMYVQVFACMPGFKAECMEVCMYVSMYVCTRVFVYLCLCPCITVPGRQPVWRGGRVRLCMCVFVCVWSRCAWPPRTACCPSVLPSVCRLRPRSANSTTPWQEDPGERDAERRGEEWKESERWRIGGRGGGGEGVRLERREGGEGDYKAGG